MPQINSPLNTTDSPVGWSSDDTPISPQFSDVYHTSSGAFAQTRHVFLKGCDLPQGWQNTEQYTILETGFGLGLNFLATWLTWRNNPGKCRRLHFVSVEAFPVHTQDILKSVKHIPQLQQLAQQLVQNYPLRLPGIYRIVFDEQELDIGQIVLTLVFGDAKKMLPQLVLQADSIFLDGFSPAKNPELWERKLLLSLSKLAAPGARLATWCVAGHVRRNLELYGFEVGKVPGLPPKREALKAVFKPHSLGRRLKTMPSFTAPKEKDAVIIGAGFAGAALCWALSQRGWQVTLIDKHNGPAQGASGLPIGLALPYISADDALISQITRSGTQWLKQIISLCHLAPQFWSDTPVEQLIKNDRDAIPPVSLGAHRYELFEDTHTNEAQVCRRFHYGLRLEGHAFVRTLLQNSMGVQYLWNTEITKIQKSPEGIWQLLDQQGNVCAQSPHVVIAAAMNSLPLCGLENKGIVPNRGQMALGLPAYKLPHHMLDTRTGHGHFLLPQRHNAGWTWSMGSTFDPGNQDTEINKQDFQKLFEKLTHLSPQTAQQLKLQFEQSALGAFVEVRCTSKDHLPMIGAIPDTHALMQTDIHKLPKGEYPALPGLYTLSALGSRGLSTGAWGAELLASMMNAEPWPFTRQQANATMPGRFEVKALRPSTKHQK